MFRAPVNPNFFYSLLFFAAFLHTTGAPGQSDTLALPDRNRELLEDILQNAGAENGDFDFADSFDQPNPFLLRPLNLNKASETDLRELGLLSDLQILNLLNYRLAAGELIALFELQAVPGFDSATIQRILPYVALNADLDDFQVPITDMLRSGRNELQLRWSRFLEKQEGYIQDDPKKRYRGDPSQVFFRYRQTYYNRMSFGLTGEKDRGEPFFKASNRHGFDFYSAHFFLRRYTRWLPALALGDYRISFGQGLILRSGYGYGKSALSTSIKRGALPLRASSSASESGFLRGAALTLGLGQNLSFTPFVSFRRRDGNLTGTDSLPAEWLAFSSFNDAGLHRTPSEINNKGNIGHFSTGATLQGEFGGIHLGLNALHQRLSPAFAPRPRPYNQFYFRGASLTNLSADYSFRLGNLNLFGESAWSSNGAVATLNGLLLTLDRKADLAMLFRHLPRHYQALDAAPFSEGSGGRNETGCYTGVELRPIPNWSLNAYFDLWQHPWLRFTADGPSRGREFRLRVTYEKRRRLRAYGEIRWRELEQNARQSGNPFDVLQPEKAFQFRVHASNQMSKATELRTRVDWGWSQSAEAGRQYGMVFLQDIIFQPLEALLSFTARFAYYHTEGYSIRFYHFENDLLNTFSIPAYYDRGSRFYLNLRFRPTRNLSLEARYAVTFRADQAGIGTGTEAIEGHSRTQLSAQIKWVF